MGSVVIFLVLNVASAKLSIIFFNNEPGNWGFGTFGWMLKWCYLNYPSGIKALILWSLVTLTCEKVIWNLLFSFTNIYCLTIKLSCIAMEWDIFSQRSPHNFSQNLPHTFPVCQLNSALLLDLLHLGINFIQKCMF